jgi:hypothetical protein
MPANTQITDVMDMIDDATQNRRNSMPPIPINRRGNVRARAPLGEKHCNCSSTCTTGKCGCKRERGHRTPCCHQGRQCSLPCHPTTSATHSLTRNTTISSTHPTQDAQAQAQTPQAATLAKMAAMQQQMQQQPAAMNATIARVGAAMAPPPPPQTARHRSGAHGSQTGIGFGAVRPQLAPRIHQRIAAAPSPNNDFDSDEILYEEDDES